MLTPRKLGALDMPAQGREIGIDDDEVGIIVAGAGDRVEPIGLGCGVENPLTVTERHDLVTVAMEHEQGGAKLGNFFHHIVAGLEQRPDGKKRQLVEMATSLTDVNGVSKITARL